MGTDILGWVEVRNYRYWHGVIVINTLISRHNDMFGCLFGVTNFAGFAPIAEGRGMPVDSSYEVKQDGWQWTSHSHTWIMWEEIKNINWDEPSQALDQRVRYYRRNEHGLWQMYMKALSGYPLQIKPDKEQSIQIGDILYKVERMTRRDALISQWEFLFKMMGMLAERFGEDKVRLVVYFDS